MTCHEVFTDAKLYSYYDLVQVLSKYILFSDICVIDLLFLLCTLTDCEIIYI